MSASGRWRLLQVALPALILILGVALRIADPGLLGDLRHATFDQFQRLMPRAYIEAPVVVVDIDEETLSRFPHQWPWPRWLVAELVQQLQRAGAAAIALDFIFAEADQSSPSVVVDRLPDSATKRALQELLEQSGLPDFDRVLGNTVGAGRVIVAFAGSDLPDVEPRLQPAAGVTIAGSDISRFIPGYPGVVVSLPELIEVASATGSLSIFTDPDAVVRRVHLLHRYSDFVSPPMPPCSRAFGSARPALPPANGELTAEARLTPCAPVLLPSLVTAAVGTALPEPGIHVIAANASGVRRFGASTGVVGVRLGRGQVIPTDREGAVLLYDTGPVAARHYPAWRVIESGFDAERIRGRIVFIGPSAAGLGDRFVTPLRANVSGSEINAQIAEQLLTGGFLRRPDFSTGVEVLYSAFVGGIVLVAFGGRGSRAGSAFRGRRGVRGSIAFLVAVAAAFALSWYAFVTQGWLVDPVYPAVVGLLTFFAGLFATYLHTEAERLTAELEERRTRDSLAGYMSRELVDLVVEQPALMDVPRYREVTVMFCDLRAFTALSKRLDSPQMMFERVINPFLAEMSRIVMDEAHGVIDKYTGDGFMAFWNAPRDQPDHARLAAAAVLEMRRALTRINERLAADETLNAAFHRGSTSAGPREPVQLRAGIGINTGVCGVGKIGWERRSDYSLLGQPANLAARFEGQCKVLGVDVVLGERTRDAIGDALALLEIGHVQVMGDDAPVRVFTLIGDAATAGLAAFRDLLDHHMAMLAAYRARDLEAARRHLASAVASGHRLELDTDHARDTLNGLQACYAIALDEAAAAHRGKQDWQPVFVAKAK